MNTGHDGSLSTIHANTPRDSLARLETMVLMAGMDLPERAIKEQVASAINVVIQIARLPDGVRKITNISEITGMEGPTVVMQDIFEFDRRGVSKDGKVLGEFVPTGVRPRFMDRLKMFGIDISSDIFEREE